MKTAKELGMTEKELDALLATRDVLQAGDLPYRDTDKAETPDGEHTCFFNMMSGAAQYSCGTVMCIGGHIGLILGLKTDEADEYVFDKRREGYLIADLFFPPSEYDYNKIKPTQAVKAIDNFLKHGVPRWEDILTKSQLDGGWR